MRIATLTIALSLAASIAAAQCNLGPFSCSAPCASGCGPISHAIVHPLAGLGGGSFDLVGTSFELTCGLGVGCPQAVPPLRFWAFDDYLSANSGCADPIANRWLVHPELDFGIGTAPGEWALYQANWGDASGAQGIDGCIGALVQPETVVELRWADAQSGEGTAAHDSWYIVAAVSGSPFDFDQIQDGDGRTSASIRAQSVPDVTRIVGVGSTSCPGGSPIEGNWNASDPAYMDVTIAELSDFQPPWFTDQGRSVGSPLIAGLQIVYAETFGEPTTSDSSAWLPALDPANPAAGVAPIWQWGTTGPVVVALPVPTGSEAWVAARVVYTDATVNDEIWGGPSGPRLVSHSGQHCGPIWPPTLLR